MKPQPPPQVPGNTEGERMDAAVRKMFSVPKGIFLQEEAKLKKQREKRRGEKKVT